MEYDIDNILKENVDGIVDVVTCITIKIPPKTLATKHINNTLLVLKETTQSLSWVMQHTMQTK